MLGFPVSFIAHKRGMKKNFPLQPIVMRRLETMTIFFKRLKKILQSNRNRSTITNY